MLSLLVVHFLWKIGLPEILNNDNKIKVTSRKNFRTFVLVQRIYILSWSWKTFEWGPCQTQSTTSRTWSHLQKRPCYLTEFRKLLKPNGPSCETGDSKTGVDCPTQRAWSRNRCLNGCKYVNFLYGSIWDYSWDQVLTQRKGYPWHPNGKIFEFNAHTRGLFERKSPLENIQKWRHISRGGRSSIGLGFLNPTLRLRRWDVMSLCMQLRNREDR